MFVARLEPRFGNYSRSQDNVIRIITESGTNLISPVVRGVDAQIQISGNTLTIIGRNSNGRTEQESWRVHPDGHVSDRSYSCF